MPAAGGRSVGCFGPAGYEKIRSCYGVTQKEEVKKQVPYPPRFP